MLEIFARLGELNFFGEFEGIYHSTVRFDRLPCNTNPRLLMVLGPRTLALMPAPGPGSFEQNLYQSSGHSRKPGTSPRNK